ncbi:hypothetical protein PAPYR_7361 [Paratrimastix pyriformis]|uniref:Endonuclease/exonuclease/phosphatase domain-containing protein n=1 Tax=Paratrimastix pyriformis TaxID=342808 RepID=A0ABQ8UD32_9EUKA|nr:hypothetical protein PAPYR_7361 [Paratrimastix pyriformis]
MTNTPLHPQKLQTIHATVQTIHPDIVCLQETHLTPTDIHRALSIFPPTEFSLVHSFASDGKHHIGVTTAIRLSIPALTHTEIVPGRILASRLHPPGLPPFTLINAHLPDKEAERSQTLATLSGTHLDAPCILGGDTNVNWPKAGVALEELLDSFHSLNMLALPPPVPTWSKGNNLGFLDYFAWPGGGLGSLVPHLDVLACPSSDHFPVILNALPATPAPEKRPRNNTPHFTTRMKDDPSFKKILDSLTEDLCLTSDPFTNLQRLQSTFVKAAKQYRRGATTPPTPPTAKDLSTIQALHVALTLPRKKRKSFLARHAPDISETDDKNEIIVRLYEASSAAGMKWIFQNPPHALALPRNPPLTAITVDGETIAEPDRVANQIAGHFSRLFTAPPQQESNSQDQTQLLENYHPPLTPALPDITDDQAKEALSAARPLSSPGPDGFPVWLYQLTPLVSIPTIADLARAMTCPLTPPPKDFFAAKLVPIPKKILSTTLDNLRPISIPNACTRLISKVLVLVLDPLLQTLEGQHAFIQGRSIMSPILKLCNAFYSHLRPLQTPLHAATHPKPSSNGYSPPPQSTSPSMTLTRFPLKPRQVSLKGTRYPRPLRSRLCSDPRGLRG